MNRLQKKCFLASAALHGLLLAVLVFGPAFLKPEKHVIPNQPLLSMVPRKLIDEALSGGGDPAPQPSSTPAPTVAEAQATPPMNPPAASQEARSEPPPKVEKKIEPLEPPAAPPTPSSKQARTKPKPKIKPVAEPGETVEDAPPKKIEPTATTKKKPEKVLDLKPATRGTDEAAVQKTRAEAKAQAEAQARAEKAAREAWEGTLGSLRKNLTGPSTTIQTLGGTGGEAYANYSQAIKKLYTDAWLTPNDVTDEKATVKVEITVARDGRIISAEITGRTGISSLDNSVRRALDRVRRLPAFPDGAKDLQRSFELNFNLKAKRSLG